MLKWVLSVSGRLVIKLPKMCFFYTYVDRKSLYPVTSTNVGITNPPPPPPPSPPKKNKKTLTLTFSFNPFAALVQKFKAIPTAYPKLLNLNQGHPSKKLVFLLKSL